MSWSQLSKAERENIVLSGFGGSMADTLRKRQAAMAPKLDEYVERVRTTGEEPFFGPMVSNPWLGLQLKIAENAMEMPGQSITPSEIRQEDLQRRVNEAKADYSRRLKASKTETKP